MLNLGLVEKYIICVRLSDSREVMKTSQVKIRSPCSKEGGVDGERGRG